MKRLSRDIVTGLIIPPMAGWGFLLALIPTLAISSPLGYFLLGVVMLGIVLAAIAIYREKRGLFAAIAIPVGFALLAFAIIFLPMYYIMNQSLSPAFFIGID